MPHGPDILPPPVEVMIRDAIAGDDAAPLRVCLIRTFHAAERLEQEASSIAYALADYIRDPNPTYSGRLLSGAVESAILKLKIALTELDKSAKALPRLSTEHYRSITTTAPAAVPEEAPF